MNPESTVTPRMASSSSSGPDEALWDCVIPYVQGARDRAAVSLVCKKWYAIDAITRKHVTIALCYTATPQQLSRRFPQLESLKLKGKPRAAMFNLIGEDWGGYVTPWVREVSSCFGRMKALHFRRMIVSDPDLEMLATSAAGKVLEVLKLDKCSGFSTHGLLHIGRLCSHLGDSRISKNSEIKYSTNETLVYRYINLHEERWREKAIGGRDRETQV